MNVRWSVNDLKSILTASWDPVSGAQGFSFWKDGVRISYTMDGSRTSARFGLDGQPHKFDVRALGILDTASTPYPIPAGSWGNGIGSFRAGDYQYADTLKALDVFMADTNAASAPTQLPNVRTLLYRSICSVNQSYVNSIPVDQAKSNGWLAKDSSGALITNKAFPSNYILDISNPAASTALGNAIVQAAKQYGFKGLWMDDTVAFGMSLLSALPAGWSQTDWYSNMVAHVKRVGAIVRAASLEFVCNANGRIPGDSASDTGDNDLKFWSDLVNTGGPTGLTREYWMENPVDDTKVVTVGTAWYQNWDGWRRLHAFCNSHSIAFVPLSYCVNGSAEMTYLRASFLLDYNGGKSAIMLGHNDASYPTFKALGAATDSAVESPSGVWTRHFQNGTVVVDANAGTATIT